MRLPDVDVQGQAHHADRKTVRTETSGVATSPCASLGHTNSMDAAVRRQATSTASPRHILRRPAHQEVDAVRVDFLESEPLVKAQRRVEGLDMDRDRLSGGASAIEHLMQQARSDAGPST